MDVFHFLVVLSNRTQRAIEESPLQEHSSFVTPTVNPAGGTHLDGFHHPRNGERKDGEDDGVPVVGKKDPGRQQESMNLSTFPHDLGETTKFRLAQISTETMNSTGDEEEAV